MSERPVALVTGASRGIGAATALEFAGKGYDVALVARSTGALEAVAEQVREAGGEALVQSGDLFDLGFAESAVRETVARFGRLDVLVNNAAWRELVTMRRMTVESWERTIRISLTAPAFLAKWAAEEMERRKHGVIINISSVVSNRAAGFSPAYMACKGGLDSLTYDLAALYGPAGIRVLAINPGAIETEMAGDYESADGENLTEELRRTSEDMIPLRRWATPDEVARVIVFMAGDDASYVTGTTVLVDGGWQHQLSSYQLKHKQFPEEF